MADITYTVNEGTPETIAGVESFLQEDKDLISSFQINQLFDRDRDKVELHIYNLVDELQESDYNYTNYKELGNAQSAGKSGASILTVNPIEDVELYGYDFGGVKLCYNFLKDLYSPNTLTTEFYIEEISSDRTELKLKTLQLQDNTVITTTAGIKNNISTQYYFNEIRLNFNNNDLLIVTNIDTLTQSGDTSVIVKMYEPLPVDILEKSTLSIVELVSDSVVYEVDSLFEVQQTPINYLQGPNFNIELTDENIIPSEYYNYDTLFSYQVSNTNSEVYSAVNSKGIDLSIDHTDYGNFIQFSSAQERLLNFKYKLDLIQSYYTQIGDIQDITTPSAGTTGSITYYETLIKGVINNFDHYEKFLYYESGSSSWPKTNNTKPYINDTTSATGSWYTTQLYTAANYDATNPNILINSIPNYLKDDSANENYLTFIHMIGQHFDNLWTYAKGVSDKYDADNRLDSGISKDLVGEVLKNFGVKLYTSNKSIEDLFSSFVGQAYLSGSEDINYYITGSLTGSNTPIQPSSVDNYQKEVYKRIYHNLPLLLKSKGTERGLRALINCFGIPSDIFDIKLYGGRNINERPFYGDYRYYTSSLDKVRLDNTGSIVTGSTLSQYTSIVKREYKYTDDLHPIELGFSPTDNVDNYIISKSLSTGSLSSFNIDNYLGDPRNLYLDSYYSIIPTGSIGSSLTELTDRIMSGSSAYDVYDFVRLIKFFDNTIFKMVKDFIPARSTADTGIIIKPHLLGRSKAKSVIVSGSRPEYTGSIDTAFIEGGDGGTFLSVTQGTVGNELNTSYVLNVQTPFGIGADSKHAHQEASYDGELRNSGIVVTTGELNVDNLFKTPTFFTNTFDVNRWLNAEGLCILNPYNTYTNNYGGIFYSSSNNTFYLDSGSWSSDALFTGLSQVSMVYEITSSNMPTSSFTFPFNTSNYANYTTHSLTASNTGVQGGCSSSVNIQVAICDIDQTSLFRPNVTNTDYYNVTSWFVTGSQNPSSNVNLTITNNTGPTTVYNGLLSGATNIQFGGTSTDTFTLIVRDTKIPLTCTYDFPISAGLCSVITSSLFLPRTNLWHISSYLGTESTAIVGAPTVNNYGLARFFLGENPDTLRYRVRLYDAYNSTLLTVTLTPPANNYSPATTGTGTFYPFFGYDMFRYQWVYGQSTNPPITGNVALFKIVYTSEYLANNPNQQVDFPNIYASEIYIEVTALENEPDCTPRIIMNPVVPVEDPGDNNNPCCFIGSTLVTLADYTQVRIDSLKVGDEVLSYNEETGEVLTSKILALASPTKKDIVKFTLGDGTEIEAARNHPFWVVGKGWSSYAPDVTMRDHELEVAQLEEGDILLTQEGLEVEISTMYLDENREYETVYNISLDNHYTYYANSILVHNKTVPPSGTGQNYNYCTDADGVPVP